MASWKPELYNADEVLNYYDNSDAVQYRLYAGTKPDPAYLRYSFDATDKGEKAEGSQQLQLALQKILNSPMNTNPYLLEIVRGGLGKGKKAITTNITFQLNQPAMMQPAGWNAMAGYQQQTSPELVAVLKQISDQNNLIISKLSAEETDDDDDAVGSVPGSPLMALINQPQIQSVLAAKLGDFLGKILNTNDGRPASMLNGTVQDDQIRQAIDILKKHDPEIGDSLLKLAQLAESNPGYFKQLITMLKSM